MYTAMLLFMGSIISGMIEPSPPASSLNINTTDSNETRRYCDPPNMTILAMYVDYYDSSEEDQTSDMVNYDFSQVEEMDFEVELDNQTEYEMKARKLFLWGSLLAPMSFPAITEKFPPSGIYAMFLLVSGIASMTYHFRKHFLTLTVSLFQGYLNGMLLPCGILMVLDFKTIYLFIFGGIHIGFTIRKLILTHQDPILLSYILSLVTVIWFVAWYFKKCPRTIVKNRKKNVPWKKIILSRVIWFSAIANFGSQFGQNVLHDSLQQYLYLVYNFKDDKLLYVPYIGSVIFALVCGYAADQLINYDLVSKTTSRRIFVYFSHFIPATLLFVVGFVGCNITGPTILFQVGVITTGAYYSGALASVVDIGQKYSSVIIAITMTFASLGKLLPIYLTTLINNGLMPGSWRMVFSVTSLTLLLTAMLFMMGGSSGLPVWDAPKKDPSTIRRRAPTRRDIEDKIIKALGMQERDGINRSRAGSASAVARNAVRSSSTSIKLKRASVS